MPIVYTVAPGLTIRYGTALIGFETGAPVSEEEARAFEADRRKRFRVARPAAAPRLRKPSTKKED